MKSRSSLLIRVEMQTQLGELVIWINKRRYLYRLDAALFPKIDKLLQTHRNYEALQLIKKSARFYKEVT